MAFDKPQTLLTPTGFDRGAIIRAAWQLARSRAERDNRLAGAVFTSPRREFGNALIAMWSRARIEAQRAGRKSKVRMVKSSFVAQQVTIYGSADFGRAPQ